jgi:hypothetical protein
LPCTAAASPGIEKRTPKRITTRNIPLLAIAALLVCFARPWLTPSDRSQARPWGRSAVGAPAKVR